MAELGIREMTPGEQTRVIDYFLNADRDFLRGMGVDPARLPDRASWFDLIQEDMERPMEKRQLFYLFWEKQGRAVGHSNINRIVFGKEAYMHLHLWQPDLRQSGLGQYFIRECISVYFETFELKTLFCEPYALNPGPNRILEKTGFDLVRTYDTVPGWINFHQTVNRWALKRGALKPESRESIK